MCYQTCEPTYGIFSVVLIDTTYMLQIILIYHGMKLINTLRLSDLSCFKCHAGKASPMGYTFLLKCFLKMILLRKIVLNLLYAACMQIRIHDIPLILTWFQLSRVCRFRVQYFFPSYRFSPASK